MDIAEVIAKALYDADPIKYDRIEECDKLDIAEAAAIIRKHVGPLVEAVQFYASRDNWEDHGYENGLHWVCGRLRRKTQR